MEKSISSMDHNISDLYSLEKTLGTLLDLGSIESPNTQEVIAIVQESVTSKKETVGDTIRRLLEAVYGIVKSIIKATGEYINRLITYISGKERVVSDMYQKQRGERAQLRDSLRTAILEPTFSKSLLKLINGSGKLVSFNNRYILTDSEDDNPIRFYPNTVLINPNYVKDGIIDKNYFTQMSKNIKDVSKIEHNFKLLSDGILEVLDIKYKAVKAVVKNKDFNLDSMDTKIDSILHNLSSKLQDIDIVNTPDILENKEMIKLNPTSFLSDRAIGLVESVNTVLVNGNNLYTINKVSDKTLNNIISNENKLKTLLHKTDEELLSNVSHILRVNITEFISIMNTYRSVLVKLAKDALSMSIDIIQGRGKVYMEITRYLKVRGTEHR